MATGMLVGKVVIRMVNFILKKAQPYMLLLDEHQEIQLQVIMADGMAAEMAMAHMRALMVISIIAG